MEKQGRMRTSSSEQIYLACVASFSYQEDYRGNGNKPASGQSWTHQQWGLCLCNNIFKKWENCFKTVGRRVRICKPRGQRRRRGRRGAAPAAGAVVTLQLRVKTMARQALLQTLEVHGGTDIHMQPTEDPTTQQVDVPEGAVCPWIGCAEAGPSQDPLRGAHAGTAPGKISDPVEDPYWSSPFLKVYSPWKGLTMENFIEDCYLWKTPRWSMEECEEGTAETMCDQLTVTPISSSHELLRGRR